MEGIIMQFTWTPNVVPGRIFIFGCGGTGSRVVPLVAQFVKSCPWVLDPELVLIDFDTVEEKNLTRQNFIQMDVGKNKAEVLASRYGRAFDILTTAVTSKVSSMARGTAEVAAYKVVEGIIRSSMGRHNMFILCVDSPEARRDIISTIFGMTSISMNNVFIDAGNENDFGQVTLSNGHGIYNTGDTAEMINLRLKEEALVAASINSIPINADYFDSMTATNTPSCADLDQTMAINTLMAVNIFGIVQNIYYIKPIPFHRLNISLQHGCTPEYMNLDFFKKRYAETSTIDRGEGRSSIIYKVPLMDLHRNFLDAYDAQVVMTELMRKQEQEAEKAKNKEADTIKAKKLAKENMKTESLNTPEEESPEMIPTPL